MNHHEDRLTPPHRQPEAGSEWAAHPPATPWYAPVGELWDEPGSQLEWLVDGLLPRDGVSLIVGPPKVGKSTLARTLCATVAQQAPDFLGRTVTHGSGGAFYAFLEGSQRSVRSAFKRMNAPNVLVPRLHVPERLGDAMEDDNAAHVRRTAAKALEERLEVLRDAITKTEAQLMVVDTLGRLAGLDDLNDYGPVVKALGPVEALARETNCHIALVHHARKSGGEHGAESMGSAGILGSVDVMLSVKHDGGRRTVETAGQRDGEPMECTVTRLSASGWTKVVATTKKVRHDAMELRVWEWIQARPRQNAKDIAKGIGARPESVRAAIRAMVETGQLVREGEGKTGDPFLYSMGTAPRKKGVPESPTLKGRTP